MARNVYMPENYVDSLGVYGPKTVRKTVERFASELASRHISVSSDALKHNFYAWAHGWSAGFVDRKNGKFVETKRSWTGLRFVISDLEDVKDAHTYIA